MPELQIVHNVAAQRFETRHGGWLSRCDYRMVGGEMHLVHTEVPTPLEGQGIAAALVAAALAWADAQHLKVRPRCSYVHAYMRRHPETERLLA